YLCLLRPECAVCKQVHQSLGACLGNVVVPEAIKLVDCFMHRATASTHLRNKAVPNHQGAQSAGRRPAHAYEFEPLSLFDVLKDFGEDADLEGGVHSTPLASHGHFRNCTPLGAYFPLPRAIGHGSLSSALLCLIYSTTVCLA